MKLKNAPKIAKIATITITIYLLCFGIAMAFFPIRPFWNDEWRLLYNIKFKSELDLWGKLDLLQECPRCYLIALKKITSFFDYSYTSLRLPALVIAAASILFCFYLKKKIFAARTVYAPLFILILISSQTFTDYLVQVKQYEMDLFLCLLALWQLITLQEMCEQKASNLKYALLCFSLLVAPFFSYVYPITFAPIIPVIIFNSFNSLKKNPVNKTRFLLSLYLPIAIVCFSITVFYIIDVKNLMADKSMYLSYKQALGDTSNQSHLVQNFWNLFSLVGSGALYEIIFGIIGVSAFFYGIYSLAKIRTANYVREDYFKLYSVLLLVLILFLFITGKLLGDVARLTAFAVPSIALLIVCFFEDLRTKYSFVKPANVMAGILFAGLFGNIITTSINTFTYPEYKNRILTFNNTALALTQARISKLPILITDAVRGDKLYPDGLVPGKIKINSIDSEQIAGVGEVCGEIILKINPEYKVWDKVPVFVIPDLKWTREYMLQLLPLYTSAIACDGVNFIKLTR